MKRKLRTAFNNWLRYQREGYDLQAEEALAEAFSHLPAETLPAGFASQILAQMGLRAFPSAEPMWRPNWIFRLVLSSCLFLGAWLVWILPEILPSILALASPGRIAEFGLAAMVGTVQRYAEGLVVWGVLADIADTVTVALTSTRALALLASGALMSILAFRTLHGFITSERSSRYVNSI